MFPKQHGGEAHDAHAAHVHEHFDLSLGGMALEAWMVIGVIFVVVQARGALAAARARAGAHARNVRRRAGSRALTHARRAETAVRARVAHVRPPGGQARQEGLSAAMLGG